MRRNIVLIGLPGSGKSTLGKCLAEQLEYPFFDSDQEIEVSTGQSIPSLFQQGEAYFRQIEKAVIANLALQDSVVIASGGGVVIDPANMHALQEKGIIIYLNRPIEAIIGDIQTSGRPLLQAGRNRLYELNQERQALYQKYADIEVREFDSLNQTLETTLNALANFQGGIE